MKFFSKVYRRPCQHGFPKGMAWPRWQYRHPVAGRDDDRFAKKLHYLFPSLHCATTAKKVIHRSESNVVARIQRAIRVIEIQLFVFWINISEKISIDAQMYMAPC